MRRAVSTVLVVLFVVAPSSAAWARAGWKMRIDRLTAGRKIGVAVREESRFLYKHQTKRRRVPASNQKLLLSMALFDALDPSRQIETTAATQVLQQPVLKGDLWLLGRGDPSVSGGGRFGRVLPFEPTRLGALARAVRDAGVRRVEGRVVGNTGYFAHDWFAPGWKSDFAEKWIALPTALSFEGNAHDGRHISDPELRAAGALTKKLENVGVRVMGKPAAAQAPADLVDIASVSSQPLFVMARYMNRWSSNFFAEVFGKRLGVERSGAPGTIAKGAAAIASWAAGLGVRLVAHDSSGLSYENKVAPGGMVRLLGFAEDQTWGDDLRDSLAAAGEGTLRERLRGVRLRAKTGTLDGISTLSGYVWLRRRDTWAEFSILSRGMSKSLASAIEDDILRILARYGR